MTLKEVIKNNHTLYQILKPWVDTGRIIRSSVIGTFRILPPLRNKRIKKLYSYKNSHKRERCFVVANGPSLTVNDLDMIKNEYCFGCNGIYKIFGNTDWRPTYWCVSDGHIIDDTLEHVGKESVFFTIKSCWYSSKLISSFIKKGGNACYIDDLYLENHFVKTNMTSWWPMSATVTVFMIELAMFMGFEEIVLLGVDNTFKLTQYKHFSEEYDETNNMSKQIKEELIKLEKRGMTVEEYNEHIFNMLTKDYVNISIYAKKHGYKIYNATVGGRVEAFPRIKLKQYLNKKSQAS